METIESCRSCGYKELKEIISFGETPLSDRLLKKEELDKEEIKAPLTLVFCPNCSLVQIKETVSPKILFDEHYTYFSSSSPSLVEHSRINALELIKSKQLDKNSLVIEIASNDGYMLKNFKENNIPVLGIDPCKASETAIKNNIPALKEFFDKKLAEKLIKKGKSANIVIANNILAHVPELNGFVEGIKTILKENGLIVIEVPYIAELIKKCEFDTIYHQHLCYFSVTALDKLFRKHNLYINNIKQIPIHGGSLRLYIENKENVKEGVKELLEKETKEGTNKINYYNDFKNQVNRIKTSLITLLKQIKSQNKTIAAYGAAAKGNTLMSFCGINKNLIDYIVDINPNKHNMFMSGNHLPIFPANKLTKDMPDYTLLLAWNFKDEILKQQKEYTKKGGRFISPVPEPEVIS
ncbi:class I SAM-dependent methyltransferase [Candidatus Woesearchaeota archaeon]|nr:class I SAM-dependent methyltransferase [Candidatus Woesearchaeota archaeon]